MKPFDLEAALKGAPVVTRDGRSVTQIHRFQVSDISRPVFGILGSSVASFTTDGEYIGKYAPNSLDLFMATTKKTAWLNMYPDGHGYAYASEEEADKWASGPRVSGKAIPFEYEE